MNNTTLQTEFNKTILPSLAKELGVKNVMAIPRIAKVKVAVGVGKIARKGGSSNSMDEARLQEISDNIARITGQKPRLHNSRKAISNFKLRAGMPIGISVTLRGEMALDFISRLVNIALPRVRDFRGISRKGFDGKGNYSLGLKDFTVFPEVRPEDTEFTHGVEITIEGKEYLIVRESDILAIV